MTELAVVSVDGASITADGLEVVEACDNIIYARSGVRLAHGVIVRASSEYSGRG